VPYRTIEDPVKLRRVLEAVLLIEADLELPSLLRHVIDEARSMTSARYCALGVLNEDGTGLAEFLTTGLEPDQERLIGARPTGLGVLGLLISDPRTLRLSRIDEHPARFGFPANHPQMTSFLGVPIKVRGDVYGNLYLTDKIGSPEFTNDDQALVEALAIAAGIAIENTRLHQQVQQVAVLEDRDRLAQDLHDTVIQHLFGVGLSLQSLASIEAGAEAQARLRDAVAQIDATITQIRTTIYGLGLIEPSAGVRSQLVTLARELEGVTGFPIEVSFEGAVDTSVSEEVSEHLRAVARESLSNVGRHAHATTATLTLTLSEGLCELQVVDDGRGVEIPSDRPGGGMGLLNLRRRAEKLGGSMEISTLESGGARLTWRVPIRD
jgi:signal transduction histidine kinase